MKRRATLLVLAALMLATGGAAAENAETVEQEPRALPTGTPSPPPYLDVEKLRAMTPAEAVSTLKASGRWRTVRWKTKDKELLLHSASLAGHTGIGSEKPGTVGEDGSIGFFQGKPISFFVNIYPGPPATPDLLRAVLGIETAPPPPDKDVSNRTWARRLAWERAFGFVHAAYVFKEDKSLCCAERTSVGVELVDKRTLQRWVDSEK